jgi:hypothetical protein
MQHKYKQCGSNQTASSHLAKRKSKMRFLHLCGPYWLIALRWMLRYKQKPQLPDKARLWPSQDKTDPPSSNMLQNGFSQELLTATARVLRVLVLDCSITSCYRSLRVYTFSPRHGDAIRAPDLRPRSGCRGFNDAGQNYSGLNQDATHVENITVAPAKPWLCAVLIQAPSHPSRTSA